MYYKKFLIYVLESYEVKLQNFGKKNKKSTSIAQKVWLNSQKLSKSQNF
jgi:hypothetical protein